MLIFYSAITFFALTQPTSFIHHSKTSNLIIHQLAYESHSPLLLHFGPSSRILIWTTPYPAFWPIHSPNRYKIVERPLDRGPLHVADRVENAVIGTRFEEISCLTDNWGPKNYLEAKRISELQFWWNFIDHHTQSVGPILTLFLHLLIYWCYTVSVF